MHAHPNRRPDAMPTASDGAAPIEATSRRRRWTAWALLVATLAIPCLVIVSMQRSSADTTDITGASWGHDFRLRDVNGRMRTLADFRGHAVVLFFGFTQCPEVCPTTLARAADVVRRMGPDGQRVQVVFVTLDPERDTESVLAAYVASFDPRFVALRGDQSAVDAVARDFRIAYRRIPTGSSYTLDHTVVTYAFDPRGRLRLAIGHTATPETMAKDLVRLLEPTS